MGIVTAFPIVFSVLWWLFWMFLFCWMLFFLGDVSECLWMCLNCFDLFCIFLECFIEVNSVECFSIFCIENATGILWKHICFYLLEWGSIVLNIFEWKNSFPNCSHDVMSSPCDEKFLVMSENGIGSWLNCLCLNGFCIQHLEDCANWPKTTLLPIKSPPSQQGPILENEPSLT